jgi:Coenzyme PQQ synthesis protein D (PqqD)
MTPQRPTIAEGLDVNETDDGLIIYQESTDRVHHLNPTAAVVFELCDGTRSAQDIARLVAETFALAHSPQAETKACIEDLTREHLIT